MQNVTVELGDRSYDILIGHHWIEQLGEEVFKRFQPSRVIVVSDQTVADLYADRVQQSFLRNGMEADLATFPAGEPSKSLSVYGNLLDRLAAAGMDRKSVVVALGGGVTGDLAGFVAASYMRGIAYVQVPTTLLSMSDSSVGGKTGIDHALGKNLIGAFYQPRLVFMDLATLDTLPEVEFYSGMAEVIKHGVIRDADYFVFLEKHIEEIKCREPDVMERLVARNCQIKAEVVAADEQEAGLRAVLNFGHTGGHALETLLGYGNIRHGEAVSIGMMIASHLAKQLCGFSKYEMDRLRELLQRVNLPVFIPDSERLGSEAILATMYGDKKTERGTLRFVLPSTIGRTQIIRLENNSLVEEAIDASRLK